MRVLIPRVRCAAVRVGAVDNAARVRIRARASVRARAGNNVPDGSNVQGGLSKKTCDRCEGSGVVKCFTCNDIGASGWTIDGSTARCDKPGMVPVMKGGVFGFGAKKVGEAKCSTCASSKKAGTIVCSRCQGNKFLYYRNSDWR